MGCTLSPASPARRYEVDRKQELGSGSQGEVFTARDKMGNGRNVAIKRSPVFDAETRRSLYREEQIMRELDHPNICRLLDAYEKGAAMYFVMELCSGGDVAEQLLETGKLPEASAANILQQVVEALIHAHGRGIAHRDLKPENICLCGNVDGTVKLIDWGMSSHFRGRSMTDCVGSITYTAPEVLECASSRKAYSEACDLWSLGVVAYTMLCGKFPFWGTNEELLQAAKCERYPTSEPVWQNLSEDAKDFVRSLLRYRPEQRMSLKAALEHPWLSSASRPLPPTPTSLEEVISLDEEASVKVFGVPEKATSRASTAAPLSPDASTGPDEIHEGAQQAALGQSASIGDFATVLSL